MKPRYAIYPKKVTRFFVYRNGKAKGFANRYSAAKWLAKRELTDEMLKELHRHYREDPEVIQRFIQDWYCRRFGVTSFKAAMNVRERWVRARVKEIVGEWDRA